MTKAKKSTKTEADAEKNYQVRLPVAVVDTIMAEARKAGHKAFGTWLRLHLVDHATKLETIAAAIRSPAKTVAPEEAARDVAKEVEP